LPCEKHPDTATDPNRHQVIF